MNPKFGSRSWVKLWVNEWLDGTTRFEMTDAQRAFWTDLIALGGRSRFPGIVCAGMVDGRYVGYPLNKFQALMSEPIDVESTLQLFERTGKLKVEISTQGSLRLFKLEIINWNKYQSEYQRQKPYRIKKLQQSDKESYTQSNNTEGEGEGEGEEIIHKRGRVSNRANGKSNPPLPPQVPNQKYTQTDFDERDLRKLAAAEKELGQSYKAMIGADVSVTDEQFFTQVCEIAGISVERGLKLKEQQRKWPEK